MAEAVNTHRAAELAWWRQEFARYGGDTEAFLRTRRVTDLNDSSWFLPEIREERGRGMDLCCGLVSMLEGLEPLPEREIWAVDALNDEYLKIVRTDSAVHYEQGDGEQLRFEDGFFDFVWCTNAIDHTPHPERMVAEIHRTLKPGGRLYMWVNFDNPPLSPCHYDLWHWGLVEKHFAAFKLLRCTVVWNPQWQKYLYFGMYRK